MTLSDTLKNILATMTIAPWHGVADVAGVAETGSRALTMTSAATPEVKGGCGSGVAGVAQARLPHLPHTECQTRVAEQPLETLGVTEIATPATPATRVLNAQQPVRQLLGPPRPKVPWCRHVWHHAYRVSRCQACGVRVPTLPAYDVSEEDSAPGGSYGA